MWGKGIDLNDRPIRALEALYVRFSEAEKSDPALTTAAREEFKKLEQGDHESREIWEKFRSASLKEMETIYQTFGIRFDEYIGESFFEKELQPIVKRLLEKGIAKFSQGAIIVPLDQFGLPPAMIQKSDGASLYLTRDIAALEYRIENYKPEKLLYVIGNEQTLAFQQLFAVSGLIGLDHNVLLSHVKYGLLLGKNGNKMSTREGTSVSINDMSEEAINRAGAIVREKNPDMPENERQVIAESIGLNALKYFMIREGRTSDIQFDWDKVLDFKGDSGPYLQYTYARLKRVLTKAGEVGQGDLSALTTEHELRLMRKMFQFPEEIRRSAKEIMTNNLTTYLYQLANLGNRFYEDQQILADENARRRNARLMLVEATASILKRGLDLLGIQVIDSI
jgi:arginyl-tRNA synthetase